MDKQKKQILELKEKLDKLSREQELLGSAIKSLKTEIHHLVASAGPEEPEDYDKISKVKGNQEKVPSPIRADRSELKKSWWTFRFQSMIKMNLEEFIGGNLINKIGIIILILGVGIGIKFAIDHELISPLVRFILGYLVGSFLLFFAFRTRRNYKNFSAVLTSGSLATFYFTTYAGHSYYSILPQTGAYIFMIAITIYAVYTSITYNREIIALIGLVGAYAIPFLLGRETENYQVLFIYIAIINGGILAVSIKKIWKWLLYSAFLVTWLLFLFWQRNVYSPGNDFNTSLIFGFVFFGLFFLAIIIRQQYFREKFLFEDILIFVTNSIVFYGVGYFSFSGYTPAENHTGLFTMGNAIVHAFAAGYLYKIRHPDKHLKNLLMGLTVAFVTIFIPVQFEANWISLCWFLEALVLIYIGRSRQTYLYEILSYIILVLAFYSLLDDWSAAYRSYDPDEPQSRLFPVFNIYFLKVLSWMGTSSNLFEEWMKLMIPVKMIAMTPVRK
jgi:uncharacterized membrane protein